MALWTVKVKVNCRIGSLEIQVPDMDVKELVNCRIGSLEISIIGGADDPAS